jgi:Fe-S oxidoreductase
MVDYIRENDTPYGPGSKIDRSLHGISGNSGSLNPLRTRIGYFPGCSLQAELPELIDHTFHVLDKLGTRPQLITQPCCGLPVINAGSIDQAGLMAKDLVTELKERKITTIITSCSGCAVTLSTHFQELYGLKLNIFHITEYLARNVKKIRTVFGDVGKGARVLYHDPCDLARKLEIIEEPRNILEAIGFRITEFERHGTETMCCGGGGGFAREFPDEAGSSARRRIREAETYGISTIVSACLSCRRHLRSGARHEMSDVEVLDLIELFPGL